MMRSIGKRIMPAALAGAGFMILGLSALPALADGTIVIRDFTLSHGIDQREPISDTESFRMADGKAFAFARIHNSGDPTLMSFVWYYGGKPHAEVPVTIGQSPGWRVWSTAKLRPGKWRVQMVDAQGEVLAEKAFKVGPGSPAPVVMRPVGTPDETGRPQNAPDYGAGTDIPASVVYPERRY